MEIAAQVVEVKFGSGDTLQNRVVLVYVADHTDSTEVWARVTDQFPRVVSIKAIGAAVLVSTTA